MPKGARFLSHSVLIRAAAVVVQIVPDVMMQISDVYIFLSFSCMLVAVGGVCACPSASPSRFSTC